MAMAMRVVGDKEDKGSKAIAIVTRMAGEWTVMATERAMVMARGWRASDSDGNKEDKGNGNGNNGGRQQRGQC
jgi:hypothetical protein